MLRIGQAVRTAPVALGVRRASPVPRHFSVALNYHLDFQLKNSNLPWDFTELINKQQQKRRFTSEAVNANDNHGEDKKGMQRVGINYHYLSHRAFSLSSGKVISKEEKGGQDAFMRSLNEKMNQVSLGKLACKDV